MKQKLVPPLGIVPQTHVELPDVKHDNIEPLDVTVRHEHLGAVDDGVKVRNRLGQRSRVAVAVCVKGQAVVRQFGDQRCCCSRTCGLDRCTRQLPPTFEPHIRHSERWEFVRPWVPGIPIGHEAVDERQAGGLSPAPLAPFQDHAQRPTENNGCYSIAIGEVHQFQEQAPSITHIPARNERVVRCSDASLPPVCAQHCRRRSPSRGGPKVCEGAI